MGKVKWEVVGKLKLGKKVRKIEDIIKVLLKNRGIKTKKDEDEFLNPILPEKISLKDLKLNPLVIEKAVKRIKRSIKNNERVLVYGDYDADGICATAILWETLYSLGVNALPYIPERFSEGYGLNISTVSTLKKRDKKLGLIISVDNGIVANEAVRSAEELGIDVIITDHHQKGKKLPQAYCIIHTPQISGSGIAWILARHLKAKIATKKPLPSNGLELVAIGSIADQIPMLDANRSFIKYGLVALNNTKRPGLLAIFEESRLQGKTLGPYEVGFIIAPRLNATGRLEHAIDSLRLLCIKSKDRAKSLALYLGKTNLERQRVVDEVVVHAQNLAGKKEWKGAIILAHSSYHEGVIGLAAARLVERFYRPSIIISCGKEISKASARSVMGFNIIESLRKLEHLFEDGGGHPMAAGFSIRTEKIEEFRSEFEKITIPLLTDEILTKKLRIDLEINFDLINWELFEALQKFEPTGLGNPTPVFCTQKVEVLDLRVIGRDGKHLRLKLRKNDKVIDAIGFGFGDYYKSLLKTKKADIAYILDENIWNGNRNLELKLKDMKVE